MPNTNSAEKSLEKRITDDYSFEFFSETGFNRFKSYFGRVEKGQSRIFTAPFAKGQPMSKVLQDWDKVLVSISTEWPSLYAFESDLAKKVGPMSVQKPIRDRYADIEHYYEDILLSSKPISTQAIDAVLKEFRKVGALRLRSESDTVQLMKLSSNSGTPYWSSKRRDVVRDTLPCSTIIKDHLEHRGTFKSEFPMMSLDNRELYEAAAVVGWRGQEGGPSEEDVKQRVIWMFPFSVNINELQVYQPFIERAQAFNIVPAWVSNDEVDKRITALFDTKGRDDLVVCTDFSRFDQHFNRDMQDAARTILQHLLARGQVSHNWLKHVFPVKYNIPLIVGYSDWGGGEVFYTHGRHGMASGSGGTNCDETLAHRALQYEVALMHQAELNPNSQCLGDDGILSYPGITVEDVIEAYQSHGQECNPDKQYASTQDCVYLRRWHHKDYRVDGVCAGVYSTNRALGRLRYLERFMDPEYWSSELVALRQLSILENCKFHPLREEFVQFCMKRDKYRLGLDIPGFFDRLPEKAKEATGHMQDFLGYTKTLQGEGPEGIADWWVVNYLKSVR